MEKRHFEMIAASIADVVSDNQASDDYSDPSETLAALERVATYIADGCAKDNPRFDRKRFMAACGFSA